MATSSKNDEAARTLERVCKLWDFAQEKQREADEARAEIGKLLRGEPAMGDLIKDVGQHFAATWKIRYKGEYAWRYTVDTPQLKRLIKLLGPEEVKGRMTLFVMNDDDFFRKAKHSFGAFVATVNQHATEDAGSASELSLASAPADCRHTPPCRSDVEHTQRVMADRRG